MKYTAKNLRKYALITMPMSYPNIAAKQISIYFVAQITKLDGEKEMTYHKTNIIIPYMEEVNKSEVLAAVKMASEEWAKQLNSGEIKIYNSLDPEKPPRIEKFKSVSLKHEIPEPYQDVLKHYYAT